MEQVREREKEALRRNMTADARKEYDREEKRLAMLDTLREAQARERPLS